MAEARPPVAMVMTTGFEIYQQQLVHGVRQVLAPRGLVLVVNTKNFHGSGLTPSVEHLIRTVSPYGVLMTPCLQADQEKELVSLLEEMEIPTVTIAVRTPGRSYVHGDDLSGMRALMAHLLDECGVRRPAHARGVPHQPDAVIREQVFREELAARGIPVDEDLIFNGEFWHEETYRELRALLNRRRDIDAVVAASDVSALGALKALTDEGLRVPDDVLVTGFDNSPTTLCWPALTTVNPEQPAQGRMAAERLLAEIDGAPPGEEVLVPSRLVVRGSTRRLPPGDPEQVTEVISLAQDAQDQLASRDALWGLAYVLSHCSSPADVADALAEGTLSRLGISRCFLAIFTDDPVTGRTPEGTPVEDPGPDTSTGLRARLLLDYRMGRQRPAPEEVFPLGQLLPSALQHELRSELLVFQPLLASDRELGYVLFEQEGGSALASDWLRNEISRTLEAMFSTRALRDYAANLEHLVATRTVELAARSAELVARSEQLESEVRTRRVTEEQLHHAVGELRRMALRDGLTQLANRACLSEHLTSLWQQPTRHGGTIALVMIDVDLFKAYNDRYGHLRGDEALREVAARLAEAARSPEDLACRFGGEEFVLALPDTDLDTARSVAERFRAAVATAAIPHETSTVAPVVTVSIGIAVASTRDAADPWTLLELADRALYQAKAQGRNQICSLVLGATETPVVPSPRAPEDTLTPIGAVPAPPGDESPPR